MLAIHVHLDRLDVVILSEDEKGIEPLLAQRYAEGKDHEFSWDVGHVHSGAYKSGSLTVNPGRKLPYYNEPYWLDVYKFEHGKVLEISS
jgi:hypothetical protein